MFGSIKYNLAHLLDFNGRDARQTFWYYVLFLVVLQWCVSIVMVIPMMVNLFRQMFDMSRAGVSDPRAVNAVMAEQMGGWMQNMAWVSMVLGLVMIALFVAAFVRRLHDSDKPGLWVALPVATQLLALGVSYSTLGNMQDIFTNAMQNPESARAMQYSMSAAGWGLVGWVGYIVVIVFGIMKSTDGPNRYGEAPVRF